MSVTRDELDEVKFQINIIDEKIQIGISENENFQNTPIGEKLIQEINKLLSVQRDLIEELATADDSDAELRHRPIPNNFTPCELGQCNCLHC